MKESELRPNFLKSEINLDNWKDFPFNSYTFQNVEELIPVEKIYGSGNFTLPRNIKSNFFNSHFAAREKNLTGLNILKQTYTDGIIVSKDGTIRAEMYFNGMSADSKHIAFSVSKSITGIVAGIVLEKYKVDPERKISEFISGTEGGAYKDASIRDLLDMTVSLNFDEEYASKQGLYARYRQAMLWMPRNNENEFENEDLEKFILAVSKGDNEHGYRFSYKSPNSDLLGLVLEKIGGQSLSTLISEELWKKIGCKTASITVDSRSMARTAGGISCSIYDLLLLGEVMRNGGELDGKRILNPDWVKDTFENGDSNVWTRGDFAKSFPEGRYRNQWYRITDSEMCAMGIHGQWIYINLESEVVICKFSSQPIADDDEIDRLTLDFFREISKHLG